MQGAPDWGGVPCGRLYASNLGIPRRPGQVHDASAGAMHTPRSPVAATGPAIRPSNSCFPSPSPLFRPSLSPSLNWILRLPPMAIHDSHPASEKIDAGENEVFRLSLTTPPPDTPIASAAAVHPPPIAGPSLPMAAPLSSRAGFAPIIPFVDHIRAFSIFQKRSAMELRTVMRALRIKEMMQANMAGPLLYSSLRTSRWMTRRVKP